MTTNEKSESKRLLEGRLDRLSLWFKISTAGVVAGLVIEHGPEILNSIRSRTFPIDLIGPLLITVGVAGELLIEFLTARIDERLREVNDSIIAELHVQAARAENRTAELQLDAAEARERQAQAEKLIAELRLNQAPRTDNFSERHFVGALEGKPKGRAEILFPPDDGEAALFALYIQKGLGISGWTVGPASPLSPSPPGAVSGPLPPILTLGRKRLELPFLRDPFRILVTTHLERCLLLSKSSLFR